MPTKIWMQSHEKWINSFVPLAMWFLLLSGFRFCVKYSNSIIKRPNGKYFSFQRKTKNMFWFYTAPETKIMWFCHEILLAFSCSIEIISFITIFHSINMYSFFLLGPIVLYCYIAYKFEPSKALGVFRSTKIILFFSLLAACRNRKCTVLNVPATPNYSVDCVWANVRWDEYSMICYMRNFSKLKRNNDYFPFEWWIRYVIVNKGRGN